MVETKILELEEEEEEEFLMEEEEGAGGEKERKSNRTLNCDICEKTFNIRGNLNMHMKRVHGNH